MTVLHTFIKSNLELISNEIQDRYSSDIITKLKDDLQKVLFIKLRPTHQYRHGFTV